MYYFLCLKSDHLALHGVAASHGAKMLLTMTHDLPILKTDMSVGFFIMAGTSVKVEAKREKQKEEIARIAALLFEEKGFEKVSLLDIAGRYGKGRTTIYEYFKDKNELLAFCLEREMSVYHEKIMSIMKAHGTLKDRMREFIKVQLVYGTAHAGYSRLFRSLSGSASGVASKTRAVIRKLHGEVYAALTREIRAAIGRGEIRDVPVELMMQVLINATSLPIRIKADPEKISEDILALFWNGVGERELTRHKARSARKGGRGK